MWACADFPAVDMLNIIHKVAAAMLPYAAITAAACYCMRLHFLFVLCCLSFGFIYIQLYGTE